MRQYFEMTNQMVGQLGEDKAVAFLTAQGLQIVERNYRCIWGETDIVAWDGKAVVFVEVKTRGSRRFGIPAEAIGRRKLRRMQRVALDWLRVHQTSVPIRFGVVTILGENEPELITEIEAID